MIMHGLNGVKVINAQQTRIIHHYKKNPRGSYLELTQQYGSVQCADSTI
jgi:hypothetical protein